MPQPAITRTAEIMAHIRDRIARGLLAEGDRLPSVRAQAAIHGASPSTIVEAYDRLVAEGVIRARAGSGFYVTAQTPRMPAPRTVPDQDRDIDPWWVSRQSLDIEPDLPKPGCGWLPPGFMPEASLRRAIRAIAKADAGTLLDYGTARGPVSLRQHLARRAAAEGLDISPDQVLLTASGSQALDLICRFLLRPGDTVLVDDPCYFNFRALLQAHHVGLVSVPVTPTGPDTALMAGIVADHRPRLYIRNSALQNPTGASLSPQTAHRILAIAAAHDLLIVEDDIFADFEHEASPRLSVLDGLERVIRIGSFSKTLSASIRCGYIVARPDWIEALTDLQIATHFGAASPVAAEIIASMLGDGGYHKHMETVRRRLSDLRKQATHRLADLGIHPWITPRGGFCLWCRLPDGVDARALTRKARAHDLLLAPGDVFSVSGEAQGFMRFNVAHMNDPRIWQTLYTCL